MADTPSANVEMNRFVDVRVDERPEPRIRAPPETVVGSVSAGR